MTIRVHVVGVLAAAAAVLVCLPASAQQQAQAGPAAAVITTTAQQQTILTSMQPRAMQTYTMVRRRGVPVLVYANGQEFPMQDADEYIEQRRDRGVVQGSMTPAPDPVEFIDRGYEQMPYTDFVNCLDYQTPVKSQSGRGMCHNFAATGMLESLAKRRMMRRGVPEQLAELDLSEEWLCYQSMKWTSEAIGDPELNNEGGWCVQDLQQVYDLAFPMEVFWPYCPESWPEIDGHAAQTDWLDGEKCAWEYWAHRDPGQKPPASIAPFRDHCYPDGPMPAITAVNARSIPSVDEGFAFARTEIADGRPVMLSLVWPSLELCNPQRTMYCVVTDYPFDIQAKKVAGEAVTEDEQALWEQYYLGGHEVLLVGYGRAGTDCEGLWLVKNSHGINSGNDGIVPFTESLLRLSLPGFYTVILSQDAQDQVDSFGERMLDQLRR